MQDFNSLFIYKGGFIELCINLTAKAPDVRKNSGEIDEEKIYFLSRDFVVDPKIIDIFINEKQVKFCKCCYFKLGFEYKIKLCFKVVIDTCLNMFKDCGGIDYINFGRFVGEKIESLQNLLSDCVRLREVVFGGFKTSKVFSMNKTFANCSSLTKLDLSNFDTSNVTDMTGLFEECVNLEDVNLSSFDTKNVKSMLSMFTSCKKIKHLNLSNFKFNYYLDYGPSFENATSLSLLSIGKDLKFLYHNYKGIFNNVKTKGIFIGNNVSKYKNIERELPVRWRLIKK